MSYYQLTPSGIAFQSFGKGIPLVMLRGLGRNMRHWLGFDKRLAERYQVILVDARGLGKTQKKMTLTTSIWDLATDVRDVLKYIGIEKAHILGVSLGGMVALAFGIKYPEKCASIVVLNTSIGGLRKLRIYPRVLGALGWKGLRNNSQIELDLIHFLVGGEVNTERKLELARIHQRIYETDSSVTQVVIKQLLAAARFSPKNQLENLKVKVLVVYGGDDRFVPNSNSEAISRIIPSAKVLCIDGAGHEISIDKADELEKHLFAWINQVG
jgi:pimeloyl-ACP methyl ester carboxylesterase